MAALSNPDFFADILAVVEKIPLSSIPYSLLPKTSTVSSSVNSVVEADNDLDEIPSEKYRVEKPATTFAPHDSYYNISQELLWDNLINDHKCTICCDVLASPVILGIYI